MTGDDLSSYEKTFTPRLKTMAVDDPSLPEEFRQRVLYEHDWAYLKEFKEKLHEYKVD